MSAIRPCQSLPDDAFVDVPIDRVIFVSHRWLSPQHPDPEGSKLPVAQAAVRSASALGGDEPFAVFLDFCSLFQSPRTAEQDVTFRNDLKSLASLVAGCYRVVVVPSGADFFSRGWCYTEYLVATVGRTLDPATPVAFPADDAAALLALRRFVVACGRCEYGPAAKLSDTRMQHAIAYVAAVVRSLLSTLRVTNGADKGVLFLNFVVFFADLLDVMANPMPGLDSGMDELSQIPGCEIEVFSRAAGYRAVLAAAAAYEPSAATAAVVAVLAGTPDRGADVLAAAAAAAGSGDAVADYVAAAAADVPQDVAAVLFRSFSVARDWRAVAVTPPSDGAVAGLAAAEPSLRTFEWDSLRARCHARVQLAGGAAEDVMRAHEAALHENFLFWDARDEAGLDDTAPVAPDRPPRAHTAYPAVGDDDDGDAAQWAPADDDDGDAAQWTPADDDDDDGDDGSVWQSILAKVERQGAGDGDAAAGGGHNAAPRDDRGATLPPLSPSGRCTGRR